MYPNHITSICNHPSKEIGSETHQCSKFCKIYFDLRKKKNTLLQIPSFFSLKIVKILRKKYIGGNFCHLLTRILLVIRPKDGGWGHYQNEESAGGSIKGYYGPI
jgi:hypothetical protein